MNEQVYNYAGLMADLALHLEQEVLTKANERIAFGCKSIETTSDDQYVSYRYKDIAMPDAIKNDKSYSISHTVTFAKHLPKDGETEGDYIETIDLTVDGMQIANFMHVSSPEVFASVEENYKLYTKIQKQTQSPVKLAKTLG